MDLTRLDDDQITTRLLELHTLKARVEGALITATAMFDRRQLFAADAARTTAGWLTARVDQTRGRCGADVALARALRSMPVVSAAFRAGRIGRAKADLLAAARTAEVAAVFADQEDWLITEITDLRVCDANRFLRAWHHHARLYVGDTDPDEPVADTAPRVAVSLDQTFEGRDVLTGEMDPEHGAIIRGAIDAEVDEMFRVGVFSADDGLSPAERRGQALAQIVARKGRVGLKHGRARPSVEVICDQKTLQGLPITDEDDLRSRICEYIDGTPLPPASLARLLCGAVVHRLVISADGEVLDAGKDIHVRRPHPPPYSDGCAVLLRCGNRAQRRALRLRHTSSDPTHRPRGSGSAARIDPNCAFPGCSTPIDWTEIHHIQEWNPDPLSPRGRTDMTNLIPLIPLCSYHHHRVHEGGYTLTLQPDGHITIHRPPDHHGQRCRITPARPWRRPLVASG